MKVTPGKFYGTSLRINESLFLELKLSVMINHLVMHWRTPRSQENIWLYRIWIRDDLRKFSLPSRVFHLQSQAKFLKSFGGLLFHILKNSALYEFWAEF